MPAVSVAGAAFTVKVGANQYEDQITSGTITNTPTITRTRTLASQAFDKTDMNSTMAIEFLFDETTGMYAALEAAAQTGNAIAVDVRSAAGKWEATSMYVESLDLTYDATNIATASVTMTGEFALNIY